MVAAGVYHYGGTWILLCVEALGFAGMGAKRWIDLYVFSLQPSELMKVSLVLALAHYLYFQGEERIKHPKAVIIPTLLIGLAVLPVLRQPDLGTALILVFVSGILLLAAGVRLQVFGLSSALCLGPLLCCRPAYVSTRKWEFLFFWTHAKIL